MGGKHCHPIKIIGIHRRLNRVKHIVDSGHGAVADSTIINPGAGLFCNQKNGLVKGYIVGVLGRYFFAFLSGLIFFASYAEGTGMSAPVYSLAYNGAYLGCEAAMTLVILAIPAVRKALARVKEMAVN